MQEQVLVLAVMVVAEVEVLDLHLPAVLYTQHSQHVLIMQNGYNLVLQDGRQRLARRMELRILSQLEVCQVFKESSLKMKSMQ